MPLDKHNVFTHHIASGYTELTAYFTAVAYDKFLHDNLPDFVPDKIPVFGRPAVNHISAPSPLRPPPYVETSPSEGWSQDSEVSKYGTRSPLSEGDSSSVFFSDGTV